MVLHAELDHKNFNHEVPGLTNRPKTTESLAQYLFERVAAALCRCIVSGFTSATISLPNIGVMANPSSGCGGHSARRTAFMRRHFPTAENIALYGKCNNPRGHGHTYLTEATMGGDI